MKYIAYILRGGEPHELAWADEPEAVGLMLETLHAEGDITDNDRVGLLRRDEDEQPGTWIINPYAKGAA